MKTHYIYIMKFYWNLFWKHNLREQFTRVDIKVYYLKSRAAKQTSTSKIDHILCSRALSDNVVNYIYLKEKENDQVNAAP